MPQVSRTRSRFRPLADGRAALVSSARAAHPTFRGAKGKRDGRAEMSDGADQAGADRIAGGALILGSLLSILAMAHHPDHAGAGALVGIVHGAMIVLMTTAAFGFAHFA